MANKQVIPLQPRPGPVPSPKYLPLSRPQPLNQPPRAIFISRQSTIYTPSDPLRGATPQFSEPRPSTNPAIPATIPTALACSQSRQGPSCRGSALDKKQNNPSKSVLSYPQHTHHRVMTADVLKTPSGSGFATPAAATPAWRRRRKRRTTRTRSGVGA